MPQFRAPFTAFTTGEVTPKFRGRSDTNEYVKACEIIKNALVLPQGGVQKRAGTIFEDVGATTGLFAYRHEDTRIIPFIFSSTEAYVIFIGPGRMHAINYSTGVVTNLGSTSLFNYYKSDLRFGEVQEGQRNDALFEIQYAQKKSRLIMVHGDYPPLEIARRGVDDLVVGMWYSPYIPGGTGSVNDISDAEIYERWPYRDQNINTEVNFRLASVAVGSRAITSRDSAGNLIDFFDNGHIGAPFIFSDGANEWCVGVITAVADAQNATIQIVDVTATTTSLSPLYTGATQHYQWSESAWSDFRGWPRTVAFYDNRLLYGGNDSESERIWGSQVNDIYELTEIGLETGASGTIVNTDYYRIDLSGDRYNKIQWLKASKSLLVGTETREYVLTPSDANDVIGPLNPPANSAETQIGSSYVQPELVNNTITFINRSGQEVRDIVFNENENAFFSRQINILAEHIHKESQVLYNSPSVPKIIQMVWQQSDQGILWCLDNNGGLFGATIDRELSIRAWHQHQIGGISSILSGPIISTTFGSPTSFFTGYDHGLVTGDEIRIREHDGDYSSDFNDTHTVTVTGANTFTIPVDSTGGVFDVSGEALWSKTTYNSTVRILSLAVLPNSNGTTDDLWMTVARSVDGVDEIFLERMTTPFENTRLDEQTADINLKPVFMDMSILSQVASFPSGTPALVHSGFDKFATETVQVLADGAYIGTKVVDSSGQITLDTAAQEVIAGFSYETRVKTLPVNAGSAIGTGIGAIKRFHKVIIKFFNTVYAKVGQDFSDTRMEEVVLRDAGDGEGAPSVVTGEKKVDFSGDYECSQQLEIYSELPYPMIVNGVMIEGQTYD